MSVMDKNRKNEIEIIATKIREENHLPAAFDLIEFLTDVKEYEIQLRQIDDNTTGLLFINELEKVGQFDSNNVIVINAHLKQDRYFEQKRRFICAHEYGHAVLHKGDAKVFARRDTSDKGSVEEQEAEYFAYCFLLPKQAINKLFTDDTLRTSVEKLKDKTHKSTYEVVAMLFNVTPKKARERLNQLGYEAI